MSNWLMKPVSELCSHIKQDWSMSPIPRPSQSLLAGAHLIMPYFSCFHCWRITARYSSLSPGRSWHSWCHYGFVTGTKKEPHPPPFLSKTWHLYMKRGFFFFLFLPFLAEGKCVQKWFSLMWYTDIYFWFCRHVMYARGCYLVGSNGTILYKKLMKVWTL